MHAIHAKRTAAISFEELYKVNLFELMSLALDAREGCCSVAPGRGGGLATLLCNLRVHSAALSTLFSHCR